jgi:hypothetical protein
MSAAIQKVQTGERARALIVADALEQEGQQRRLLGEYVRSHMIEGTDYGVVPGTSNRTLLKPGAEKLTQLYRCVPRFVIEEKTENWETGLFFYRFSCQIVTQADDAVVAEGVGSCSTWESRYRWRQSARACPECGKEAIIKGKREYGGGWLCFGKKGGCGAKFPDGDQAIEGQPLGRVPNPDIHDQANTVLKMAKKRALVDAAIALARCSDIFTQDLDDLVGDDRRDEPPAQPPARPQPVPFAVQIRDAGTMDELQAAFARVWAARGHLEADVLDELTALKDQRKAELLQQHPAGK